MTKILKRPLSILLAAMMVLSLFVAVPATASATTDASYVKVTSAPDDWSGDYLIVYEDNNKAFNGGLDTLDAAQNTIDVTINSDVIASNTTTDAAKFTVEAISGGYSIKSASGYYIGGKDGSNYLNSSKNDDFANTFAMDGENVIITSNTSVLGFNTAANQLRFRYFKSSSASGKYVQLYKLTDSAADDGYIAEEDYLTFTALEDDSSVMLSNVRSGSDYKYNKNNTGWQNYDPDDYDRIWLNKGEYVRFRGSDTVSNSSRGSFSIGRKVAASGNIMSLRLDSESRSQGLTDECFINLFSGCEGLITAPELPETTLANECYDAMFEGCKNLTTAPALPATTLAYGCYADMFMGCKSLTEAPALPATSLATYCYGGMFDGCTSLTELPELPATTLANYCYSHMFSSCSNIRISDEAGTINGIKYSEAYRIPTEGTATNASYALDSMFYATGGKFKGTPNINTTYYIGKPVYTVTWKNGDNVIEEDTDVESGAAPSFNGTTPEKASDTYYDYTFSGWSDGTTTYGLSDTLPNVTADVTYTAQYTETAKTFKVIVMKLTGGTYNIENLTGETTVAQLKEIIADQIDIPATAQRLIFAGKDIEDAKTLAEYNIQKESKIHVVAKTYTVTWLNYDNSELGTTTVQYGATPSYNGTPERPEDANNTYTFSGWSDGTTTYGLSDTLPNVTADVTYTAQFTAVSKGINYGGDNYIKPDDTVQVSDNDEGATNFGLNLPSYLNMQMLGIQKKSAIATQGGDDGIRFVTAVNSNLLKGSNIEDYGYIVVKAKEGTSVDKIYQNMDKLTYDKVGANNRFTCKGTSNTISGDFGKFDTDTDYKYVTLSLTGTSGSNDTVAARFYVKTTDGEYHYADYIDGNNQTHGGMAFTLPIA